MMAGNCRHFTGTIEPMCKALVNYRDLVGGPDFGWAARLPCIPESPFRKRQAEQQPPEAFVTCADFDPVTKAEYDAWQAESMERFAWSIVAIDKIKALAEQGYYSGKIACTKEGCPGQISFSTARSNGHTRGACSAEGCLTWIE